jgi:hypothetical protein
LITESASFGPTACGSLHQQLCPFIKGLVTVPKIPWPAVVFTPVVASSSARRFRRPPRYPDYATGPTSMLNNAAPYINEIVIMTLACLPVPYMIQALRQMFCNHEESFVYRKYEEFQFIEFCNCTRCGKTLKHFFGFDEDVRG